MIRFTARELAALESAGSFGPDFDHVVLMREAREMRAKVIGELLGHGLRRLAALLGLPAVAQRLAHQRLYRRTVSELSQLDARALQDIGINRGEIDAAARTAAGLGTDAQPGLFARLRQAAAEARQRRRTAQDLAALDRRLLLDIGVEPDGIEHFVDEARRYGDQPHPVLVTATPAIALDLLFSTDRSRQVQVAWDGKPRAAANHAGKAARAA